MDELRRRAIAGDRGASPPRRKRIGEPNVLSDAATPNVLSTQAGRPQPLAVRAAQPSSTARVASAPQANQGWPATARPTAPTGIRLPSFGTLLFLGFLAITAVRVFGQLASGITGPTTAPAVTSPAGPGSEVAPGPVTFGTGLGEGCEVTGATAEFGQNEGVWWSAVLSTVQPADAAAVVVVRRDGREVHREFVPSDSSSGEWSVLCAGEPITLHEPGAYRLEVWNEAETVLHAAGEYRLRDS